jgi:hypothetical protein
LAGDFHHELSDSMTADLPVIKTRITSPTGTRIKGRAGIVRRASEVRLDAGSYPSATQYCEKWKISLVSVTTNHTQ